MKCEIEQIPGFNSETSLITIFTQNSVMRQLIDTANNLFILVNYTRMSDCFHFENGIKERMQAIKKSSDRRSSGT